MANENRAFGTHIHGERRAFAPLHIQNQKQQITRQPIKPLHANICSNTGAFEGQENNVAFNPKNGKFGNKISNNQGFNQKSNNAFQIYDEGICSQETVSQPTIDDRILADNMEAVKKELSSFLIDSLEKNSSELSDRENKENRSMCIDDSFLEAEPKEQSTAEDSVLDQSEISYTQQCSDFDRFAEYSDNIFPYMLEKERKYMPDPFYMNNQSNINSKMRSILVDWLVDVADEYNIKDETLFLAINYIDRFLSKVSISRQEFQLLGTAALFIASKYEEIYPPEIGEFVFITDDSFNKLQILQMEKLILTVLEFDVSTPTVNYFLEMYVANLSLDIQVYCLSKYFCFLSALECSPFLKYYPSEIALCSILSALKILGCDQIPEHFIRLTYTYEHSLGQKGDVGQLTNDRKILMDELAKLQAFAGEHQQQAIQRKFSTSKYYHVAKLAGKTNN